jgi:hypothetical protein
MKVRHGVKTLLAFKNVAGILPVIFKRIRTDDIVELFPWSVKQILTNYHQILCLQGISGILSRCLSGRESVNLAREG